MLSMLKKYKVNLPKLYENLKKYWKSLSLASIPALTYIDFVGWEPNKITNG